MARQLIGLVAAFAGVVGLHAGGFVRGQTSAPTVSVLRVPDGGLQPQVAIDAAGLLHVVYFNGEPANGDLFYTKLDASGGQFSTPIRVNTQPGGAIATGTVRGAHVAVGRGGQVHVAWMGSSRATPRATGGAAPMMYTRLDETGRRFEPERNVLQFAVGLDGGGSLAADASGNVYVAWHAGGPGSQSEADRRVWLARSTDDGRTFAREAAVSDARDGACGCCGMRVMVDNDGAVRMLYRSATEMTHRDTYLLTSRDQGRSFTADKIDEWNVGACQMSTYALARAPGATLAAWETAGDVRWLRWDHAANRRGAIVTPPGSTGRRKHPSITANTRGEVLLVWAEGTGWNKGGELAWQLFSASGVPIGTAGRAPGVPTWSLAAAATRPDGGFVVVY